jgi:hypothetical protein
MNAFCILNSIMLICMNIMLELYLKINSYN